LTDVELKDKFIATLETVNTLLSTLDKLYDAQKLILSLDAIFSHLKPQRSLNADYKKFLDMKKTFKS